MMNPATVLRVQSARALAFQPSRMVSMQFTRQMSMRQSPVLRMKETLRLRRPMPKEEHSAHTISQRIRTLKKIPPELIPLGVVLAAAIIAAGYSMVRHLVVDRTLRLSRQSGKNSPKH